jgi:hypothetical protein
MIKSPDLKNEISNLKLKKDSHSLSKDEKKRLDFIEVQVRIEQDELKTV